MKVWTPGATIKTFEMPLTRVKVDGDWIPICMEELVDTTDLRKVDPSKYHPERYVRHPNGRLRIRIRDELEGYRGCSAPQRSWSDGDTRRIERNLNAFIVALFAASGRKRIGDDIRDWRFARDVRALAAEARQIVEAGHCEITPGGDIDLWLRWCESHADSIDPLASLRRAVAERTKQHADECEKCQKRERDGGDAPTEGERPSEE